MAEEAGDATKSHRAHFRYVKSNFFRVAYADGFIVGLTLDGNLYFESYTTRAPIPDRATFQINADGSGEELREETIVQEGLVREVDFHTVLGSANAISFAKLLLKTAEGIEARKAEAKKKEQKTKRTKAKGGVNDV